MDRTRWLPRLTTRWSRAGALACGVAAAVLAGCGADITSAIAQPPGGNAPGTTGTDSVTVSPRLDTLGYIGAQRQLSATVAGPGSRSVAWASLAPAVATVSETGLVTATGHGTALITASGHVGADTARIVVAPIPSRAADECASPRAGWIWCDDFETDRMRSYFEVDSAAGNFVRAAGVGRDGSVGMRARWAPGQVAVGSLKLAFGRTPFRYMRPVDTGTTDYREIFWRVYTRNEAGWEGGGAEKMSRATSIVSSAWAQSMIAHVWSGADPPFFHYLYMDPASGTDAAGTVRTTRYNDFGNLRWLGSRQGTTPLFAAPEIGAWHCVEARVRLNDALQSNGVFELWVNGQPQASRTDLNWVGSYDAYGINAVFLENYWNRGSPRTQERYFDNLVVSTQPIGC